MKPKPRICSIAYADFQGYPTGVKIVHIMKDEKRVLNGEQLYGFEAKRLNLIDKLKDEKGKNR